MSKLIRLFVGLLVLVIIIISDRIFMNLGVPFPDSIANLSVLKRILIIFCISWILIELTGILKTRLLRNFDISKKDNLKSRKLHTQINILEKVISFIILMTAIGLALLSIEKIREIGIGLFASAGIAGIILGLSAQKVFGALFAGIQIAITQPFNVDDAVFVEGEWGWIEEINLTYIVVRIWDKRRLVLPTTYFIENPFQNWTRTTSDIIGSVYLYTDYSIEFDTLRKELTRLLESTDLWDNKVNVMQVTDTKETTIELRILVSARNSPDAWDLRVFIREKMVEFIRNNFPESLPKTRIMMENNK